MMNAGETSEAGRTVSASARGLRCLLVVLAGPIPPELGDLAALHELSLWNNKLSGELSV